MRMIFFCNKLKNFLNFYTVSNIFDTHDSIVEVFYNIYLTLCPLLTTICLNQVTTIIQHSFITCCYFYYSNLLHTN